MSALGRLLGWGVESAEFATLVVLSPLMLSGDTDRTNAAANTSAAAKDDPIDRKDSYVVRIQAQGTSLRNEASVPLVATTPISNAQVQAALATTATALTPKEQARMASAFAAASAWAGKVAAAGGIGPIGSTTFNVPGYKGSQARVDIEILKGHNIVP